MTQAAQELAARLAAGWQDGIAFDALPSRLVPTDVDTAYAVQMQVLHARDSRIGGWKVGAKAPDAPIQGAPLPADGLHASGVTLPCRAFRPLGLELEIAFRLGREFVPGVAKPGVATSDIPHYSAEEVLDSITSMSAAIEIVASRYREWPAVAALAQLADLQNHGALVLGEAVPYRADFPFDAPRATFTFDGHEIGNATAANPAGDPRRLLPWLINHAMRLGITLPAGTLITTGSYTGLHVPHAAGAARGAFAGLPPVSVTLA
jgi:2-keto-4-pentenoate hydratase